MLRNAEIILQRTLSPTMPAPTDPKSATRRDRGAEPLRRRRAQPPVPGGSPRRRQIVNAMVIFSAIVLLVDALVGDTGFIQRIRARRQVEEAEVSLSTLQRQNAQMREYIRRLRDDPSLIEALAREELGLIRPGNCSSSSATHRRPR